MCSNLVTLYGSFLHWKYLGVKCWCSGSQKQHAKIWMLWSYPVLPVVSKTLMVIFVVQFLEWTVNFYILGAFLANQKRHAVPSLSVYKYFTNSSKWANTAQPTLLIYIITLLGGRATFTPDFQPQLLCVCTVVIKRKKKKEEQIIIKHFCRITF